MGGLCAALWMFWVLACLQKYLFEWSVCCGASSLLSVHACARREGCLAVPACSLFTDDMILRLLLGLFGGPSGF